MCYTLHCTVFERILKETSFLIIIFIIKLLLLLLLLLSLSWPSSTLFLLLFLFKIIIALQPWRVKIASRLTLEKFNERRISYYLVFQKKVYFCSMLNITSCFWLVTLNQSFVGKSRSSNAAERDFSSSENYLFLLKMRRLALGKFRQPSSLISVGW